MHNDTKHSTPQPRLYVFTENDLANNTQLRQLEFLATSLPEAAQCALYTARLKNGHALLGATGKVLYPYGLDSPIVWVYNHYATMKARQGQEVCI